MNEQPPTEAVPAGQAVESTEPQSQPRREPPQHVVAMRIADRLGEVRAGVRRRIKEIVRALGRTQSLALLEETLRIEEQGGMLVPDESRRRTPGGVFFQLVYTKGQPKEGRVLPPQKASVLDGSSADAANRSAPAPSSPPVPFTWAERIVVLEEIGQETGKAANVKITVVGTIGKYVDKGSCVVGVMEHAGEKFPAFPKGVPAPQPIKTAYTVYIGAKQWKKIAEAANDPEDALIIEGFPQVDIKTGMISVFATNASSKKLQTEKKQKEEA